MAEFSVKLISQHPPEEVWEALITPIPAELTGDIISSKVAVSYEKLSEEGQIQQDTLLTYTPDSKTFGLIPKSLTEKIPSKINLLLDKESSSKTRTDVIVPNKAARGQAVYRVEEAEDNTALLLVTGKLTIEKSIDDLWPSFLGDIGALAVYYGIQRPAEQLLEHVPAILSK